MIYIILTICIAGMLVSYPIIYASFLFPQEMEKYKRHMRDGHSEKALRILQKLPTKKQNTLEIQLALCETQLALQHPYLALFHLNEILAKKLYVSKKNTTQTKLDLHLRKAQIYESGRQTNKGIEEYLLIVKLQPKHVLANTKIGLQLFSMKNYAAALGYLKEAYSENQEDANLCETLSDVYITQEAYTEALTTIRVTIKLRSLLHCRLRHKEVFILFKLGRYDEALPIAENIDKSYLKIREVDILSGLIHIFLDNTEKAKPYFIQHLNHYLNDYSPLLLEARYFYQQMLFRDGAFDQALQQVQFIEKKHETYRETEKLIPIYKKIVRHPHWNDLISALQDIDTSPLSLPRHYKYLTHKDWSVTGKLSRITPKQFFYTAQGTWHTPHHPTFFALFLDPEPMEDFHRKSLQTLPQKSQDLTGQTIESLILLSLFPIPPPIRSNLEKTFKRLVLYEEDSLLQILTQSHAATSQKPNIPETSHAIIKTT